MKAHISSLQHPLVKHLVKLRQNRQYRYEQQSIVVESYKPICELCQQVKAKAILTCDPDLLPPGLQTERLYLTTEAVMQKVSGMQHPEGLVAEMPMPPDCTLEGKRSLLVVDNINDPGNLGTLLRTALALGWDGAFILGKSCDPFNEKTLRASRGACLKLPLRHGSWDEVKLLSEKYHLLPLLADLSGNPPKKLPANQGVLLILSNEAHGPSPEALQWCQKVSIPLPGQMESLNVASAGAILMYTIRSSL